MVGAVIHHGDLFDVLPTLDAESIDACVTDPPYGILRGSSLKLRFDRAVAAMAERQKVAKCVGCDVVADEESVRPNVMNIAAWAMALLAGVIVALPRFALLRLPVWSTVAAITIDELRVSGTDAVGVATRPRTVLTFSVRSNVTRTAREGATASDAGELDFSAEFCGHGGVLARRRTGSAASVFQAGRHDFEIVPARLTADRNHASILQGAR